MRDMDEADRVAHQALIERHLKRFHNEIEGHSAKLVQILEDQAYPGSSGSDDGAAQKKKEKTTSKKGWRPDLSGLAILSAYGMTHKVMDFWTDPIEITWGPPLVDTLSYEELIASAKIPLESNPDVQKVLLVLCSITSQMRDLRQEGWSKFVLRLILYGDGFEDKRGANTSVTEGRGHVAIANFLPVLYELDELRESVILLMTNAVQQLGALFKDSKPHVVSITGLHLPSVFRELANLLSLLVVLDEVIGNQPILQEHWTKYRRMIKSVRADSGTFSVDPSQLVKLEKDLTQLDRHIMTGHIFRTVVERVTSEAGRSKSNTLVEKITFCLTTWANTVEKDFTDGVDELKPIAIASLFIFAATLFPNSFDGKKVFQKTIWENLKKIPAVPIAGALLWVPESFFSSYPITNKFLDTKTLQTLVTARHTFLQMKVGSLANDVLGYNVQIATWSLRLQETFHARDLSHAKREDLLRRSNLLSQGVRLAESLSQNFRLIINLHATLGRPVTKQTVSLLCQILELVKLILCVFHRFNVQVCESAAAIVQNVLHIALSNVSSLQGHFLGLRDPKRVEETRADTLAALSVLENVLKSTPSEKRLLVAKIAFEWVTASYRLWREEDNTGVLAAALDRISLMVELQERLRQACDGSFIYWHRVILSAYFSRVYAQETEATKLPIMFLVLNDCLEMICTKSQHGEDARRCFVSEVEDCFATNLVDKLCRDVETDLRLMTHTHLNPKGGAAAVETKDFQQLLEVAPILFNGNKINLHFVVEHYLAKTYYNLASVALHDWQSYATMRVLASDKYGLDVVEDHLPGHSLEQGLDVLEIVRNLGKFVTEFSYSLNNQVFVQVNSPNKHLDTVNIRHLANSMRTHGPGLTNTTVNSTYQFLRSKIYILSQFLYDEQIKSRLAKEIRLFKQASQVGSNSDSSSHGMLSSIFPAKSSTAQTVQGSEPQHAFPYERVLKFQSGIRKLGLSPEGLSPLDQFRVLITHIGNALGFVRLVSSGQLHFLADGCRFIPDLEDIPELSTMVRETHENSRPDLREIIEMASVNVDAALKCLSSVVCDGVDYLRLLANGFAGPLREQRNSHLKNFYVVVPALTLSYVDHMRSCKEKLLKKSNSPPIFTDDGFPMGVAFLLNVLGQDQEFDSLHWFSGVTKKLTEDRARTLQAIQESKKDEKLQQANTLTAARLQDSLNEFNLLRYNLSSARIFFRQQQLNQKTNGSA